MNRHLNAIGEVENSHFWHVPRRRMMVEMVEARAVPAARVLDLGCGTGAFCCALRAMEYDACGLDRSPGRDHFDTAPFLSGDAGALPFASSVFDFISALDVLEHIDDRSGIAEIFRVLKPGGVLLASVPAYKWLWSERDVVAGHLRRYGRREFRDLLGDAGFIVERVFGYQFFLLPVVILTRWYHRLRGKGVQVHNEDRPGNVVNAVFRAINEAEVTIGRLLRPPVGSSLVAIARKPGG